MTTPNQNPNSFRGFRGQFASTSELPNVGGSSTQDPTLAEGQYAWVTGAASMYVCTDATAGSATWEEISGAGDVDNFRGVDLANETPDSTHPESWQYDVVSGDYELKARRGELRALYNFFGSNSYEAATNGLGGSDSFLVAAVVLYDQLSGSDRVIASNFASGVAGWKLEVKANGQWAFTFVDSNGDDVVAETVTVSLTDHPAGRPDGKFAVLLAQVSTGGGESTADLYVNGTLCATASAGAGHTYAPRTGTVTLGGPGSSGPISLVSFAYAEDVAFLPHTLVSYMGNVINRDGVFYDSTVGTWTAYSVVNGVPNAEATWDPDLGTGPTFNKVGTVEALTYRAPIWS